MENSRLQLPVLEDTIDLGDNGSDLYNNRQVIVGLPPEHLTIAEEDDEAVLAVELTAYFRSRKRALSFSILSREMMLFALPVLPRFHGC